MQFSRLGFGTSGLMGAALTQRGRLRLLAAALDQGITHFDTAPLYGRGLAEEVVGRFARGRRQEITITTKVGLPPGRIPAPLRPLLPVARVLHRRLLSRWRPPGPGPAPTTTPGAGTGEPSPPAPLPPYSPAEIRSGLENSLRLLATDYIDAFLLHECTPERVSDEVISLLEQLVQEGKIRRWGIGTGRPAARRILEQRPGFQGVVQIADDLLQVDTGWFATRAAAPLFTHSVLQTPLRTALDTPRLQGLLQGWGERTGRDPGQPGLLSELLLLGGLLHNPQGCVLFSTSRAERLAANAAVLRRLPSLEPAFRELLATASDATPTPCS